ncbi:DNA repair protein xrcc4 [Desmophyllum pertusum]|uniref:DNA repair protein xrcc4 n=1 Tax=Desmophyllum pertusum TaxID=174260 RepID=A0A9X0CQP1_9CNID|nr:DNA repair protein xrcc4 [Desmophyllum pertusum]
MQQHFSRIEAGDVRYYLLTELLDEGKDGFILTVCNGGQVWRETVDSQTVESMAKTADMSVAEFADQTGRALTGQTNNFLGRNILEMVLSVIVINEIFDLAVDQMAQLKQEKTSLRSDNARLSSERKDALKLLDKCVTAKEEMEKDLFEKFAAVLNDKKSKIRQLKELVSEAAAAEPVQGNKLPDSTNPSKEKQEESDDDTDIEKMESEDSPVAADSVKESKQKPLATAFSPSLLPEDENDEIEPTVKRRRRRDPKPKESPAAKLVLPKVPSVRKTPSSSSGESLPSSRSRLRQAAAEKSLPDADDLMAEMEM